MGRFEDSLWTELQREHGQALLQNMAKQRSKRTTRWIGAAAAVAVLGTGALAASTYFGGAPPAYAVVDNPDGSVTLTIREVEAFGEATEELRKRGIRAIAVPMRVDCPIDEYRKVVGLPLGVPGELAPVELGKGMREMKIHRDRIPSDATLVLSANDRDRSWSLYGGSVRGEMPTCVPGGHPPVPIEMPPMTSR
jgi:hypothetical protein